MAVELRDISKWYGGHRAVEHVSLSAADGEFLTLLGPSGCGKTTLLRCIGGLIEPTTGAVFLDGEDITNRPAHSRGAGFLFQSYALFPHLTVAKNVAFGLRMRKWQRGARDERVEEVLELVDMAAFADRFPAQLSGGQQQRVALARTLAIYPKVLLLDEPLAALDRRMRQQMQSELRSLIDRVGITTIFVTHDQDEAMALSDSVAVMRDGNVEQHASPMELYDYPATRFAAEFLGNSNLLEGVVDTSATESMEPVFRSGPLMLSLRGSPAERQASVGPATLLLRPEHLRLGGRGRVALGEGQITRTRDMGQGLEYEIALDDGPELLVHTPRTRGSEVQQVGERVPVTAEPDAFWLIPEGRGDGAAPGTALDELSAAAALPPLHRPDSATRERGESSTQP